MPAPNVANILKANAIIYKAPDGTPEPDWGTIPIGGLTAPWDRFGYTKTPLAISKEIETFEIEVEENLNPVAEYVTKINTTWEVELAELTADNIALAFNGEKADTPPAAGEAGYSTVTDRCDLDCQQLIKCSYVMEGQRCDNDYWVRFYIPAGTATINGELTFSKKNDDYTGIPLQIKEQSGSGCSKYIEQTAEPLP